MKYYITVDGGTTNTRISLIADKNVLGVKKINIGAKKSIDGVEPLKNGIAGAIKELLSENDIPENDIERVLASGMITSEFGLCELTHLIAPAGISELHGAMHEVVFTDICSIPFVFIRGIKTVSDQLSETDMMRGEETELFGLTGEIERDAVYVLPGSHSKIISTDASGRISRFSTMLTGEMIAALTDGTILKDAVDLSCEETDSEHLIMGYAYARENGINGALFKVRILKNLMKRDKKQVYSFFLGAVLCDEIAEILKYGSSKIIIGGRRQIKEATAEILRHVTCTKVVTVSDTDVELSTSRGMIRIYENK